MRPRGSRMLLSIHFETKDAMTDFAQFAGDDAIAYTVSANRILNRRTVQVTVPVEMLLGPEDIDQAAIEGRVFEALNRFLPGDWVTSSVSRSGAAAGYERLNQLAAARVPLQSAYNLEQRARAAGVRGLSLGEPRLDYRVAKTVIAKATAELRKQIVNQVNTDIVQFNEWTGRVWRIGLLEFGVAGATGQRTAKGAYRNYDDLDQVGDPDGSHPSGIEQLKLVASVTLRSCTHNNA
jgi:hypothetical protein